MSAWPFGKWSLAAAALALAGVGISWATIGGTIFTAGELHAGDSTATRLGGVTSHAALARECGACHAAPWSGSTMSARCLDCHVDIQEERRDTTSLHGGLADVATCLACHTEHLGPRGAITRLEGLSARDHARLGFPLDGAHATVACTGCHEETRTLADFSRAPTTCIGCHRDDDAHEGDFGSACDDCHGTDRWERARFEHEFPLDHGGEGRIACRTCHEDRTDWKRYTCYGCHEHAPARVRAEHEEEGIRRNLEDCVRCHPTGQEDEAEGEGEGEGRRRGRHERDGDDH